MIDDKDSDYVTAWPRSIATRYCLSTEYVIQAINTVTGASLDRSAAYGTAPLPEVAALTPDQAKAVAREVARISQQLDQDAQTHCHYCGTPVSRSTKPDFFGVRACSGCS